MFSAADELVRDELMRDELVVHVTVPCSTDSHSFSIDLSMSLTFKTVTPQV